MENLFKATTEHVLSRCADDVELFHKYIAPGHRVCRKILLFCIKRDVIGSVKYLKGF